MISIIIPTLNEESVLEATLRSLQQLTAFPYEVIISDGRSTDRTLEIARRFTDKVVIYDEAKRQTIGNARNLGARLAQGEFLLFLDADATMTDPNTFFTTILDAFAADNQLVAVTVPLRVLPQIETRSDRFWYGWINLLATFENNVLGVGISPGEFQMMRKSIYRESGGYNEILVASEDYEMFGRLAKLGKTRMLRNLTLFHTGRRPHKIGWTRLASLWFLNWASMTFRKKSWSKEWIEIR